jgi:hypothetical protein
VLSLNPIFAFLQLCQPVLEHRVSLSKGLSSVTLTWVGFSESQMLCTMDSEGTVRGLVTFRNGGQATAMWTPLVDLRKLRKSPRDCHYMVGVTDKHVLAVLCKVSKWADCVIRGCSCRFDSLFDAWIYLKRFIQPGRCHLPLPYPKTSSQFYRFLYSQYSPPWWAWWWACQRGGPIGAREAGAKAEPCRADSSVARSRNG